MKDTCYALYYRSATSGNWNVASTWLSSAAAGGPFNPSATTPTSADETVNILSGHTVRINAVVSIDEVTVDLGGTLIANITTSGVLNFANGTGTDLIINGTFIDSLGTSPSITFSAGAGWSIAAGASLIKYTASGSNIWQTNYQGGINTIPVTANWILRKVGTSNPAISTTAGVGNAIYPNLIIENNTAGIYTASGASNSFTTTAGGYPIVKGNFDIGGTGSSTVDFTNICNGTLKGLEVQGSMFVRTGCAYRNNGTSTEIQTSLTVDGTLTYSSTNRLDFTGANPGTINGAGTLKVYSMSINKTADIALNRYVLVDFLLTLTNGRIISSLANPMMINIGATVSSVSNNNSFVHGPCRKYGNEAFVFPVGKGTDVQPAGVSAAPTTPTSLPFWTETFGSGCTANCSANGFTGVNGSWTTASTGTNGNRANQFFVSCAENGNAIAACGSGCGSNATLHVGVTACPTCAVCPSGDCGATFDSLVAGGNDPTTNIRVISPSISTIGRSTIVLTGKYIEGGDATDNMTIEYSLDNGANWSSFNIAKTSASCSPKGQWAALSYTFPVTCNNLPNFRFGFRWTNNTTAGTGLPFSFAADDLVLSATSLDSYTAEYFYTNPTVPYGTTYNSPLEHVSRMEYWKITREAGTTKRKITLNWDGNSGGVTSLPDLRVANHNGTSWDDKGNTGYTGSTGSGTVTSDSVSGVWNVFTLSSVIPYPGNPLPVELLNFTGERKNKNVLLKWTTASEKNNDYFTLRKSPDNFSFAELGRIDGAGTTNTLKSYSYLDTRPLNGINYYQLLQTDFDGTTTDQGTVAVRFDMTKNEVIVTPDATQQQIILNFSEVMLDDYKVELIDVAGKLIFERSMSSGQTHYSLPANHLSTGVYFIRVNTSGDVIYKRFFY